MQGVRCGDSRLAGVLAWGAGGWGLGCCAGAAPSSRSGWRGRRNGGHSRRGAPAGGEGGNWLGSELSRDPPGCGPRVTMGAGALGSDLAAGQVKDLLVPGSRAVLRCWGRASGQAGTRERWGAR